jgi:SAM-dependent methyltransferase
MVGLSSAETAELAACQICGSETRPIGSKVGKFYPKMFSLRHCPVCLFSFISNPWTDFPLIYSAEYYAGKGADPYVDYQFELDFPGDTVRQYEWCGLTTAVQSLLPIKSSTQWLDFGCGNGGLVRHLRAQKLCEAFGFEEGAIRDSVRARGVPLLTEAELESRSGTFDIVTAIEVLEHIKEPLPVLRCIRKLLKKGGLFFYTTGNARPYRASLHKWRYVVPEIHVSFYEPDTLRRALVQTGFRPEFRGYIPGFTNIFKFKILKNLGVRRHVWWQHLLPWPILARVADARYQLTRHPVAWAE